MSSDKKQEQAIQKEFDGQVRDIRNRLSEQLVCLEKRSEVEKEVLQDFQEYFQSRADIEKEYARKLERLYESHAKKRRVQTPTKESDPQIPSTIACWNVLMDMTKSHQKQHQLLGNIYGDHLSGRFNQLRDALETVYKKSRDMTAEVHMEILGVVTELFSVKISSPGSRWGSALTTRLSSSDSSQPAGDGGDVTATPRDAPATSRRKGCQLVWERRGEVSETALKSYHNAHTESKRAGNKYKQTEQQIQLKKGSNREKSLEKQLEKSMGKFQECQLKATKARNDYLLHLSSANTTLQKYFKQDVMSLIDCLDLNYVPQIKRTLSAYHSAELEVHKLHAEGLKRLELHIKALEPGKDKELFLNANPVHFAAPEPFVYQPHGGDEVSTVVGHHDILCDELSKKYNSFANRLETLNMETDEIKKTLDTVMGTMRDERVNILQEDISRLLTAIAPRNQLDAHKNDVSRSSSLRRKHTTSESEVYYLDKYKEYLRKANGQARIESKLGLIQEALSLDASHIRAQQQRSADKPVRKMRPRPKSVLKAKLFGGPLEDYISITKSDIPSVVESCIEFISLYGMSVEGIFRMPGSQTEVNSMKAQFDSGEDPLPDIGEKGDVHLVASVLKAYFRELPTPLFPLDKTVDFMNAVMGNDLEEKIEKLTELVLTLPKPIMIVMRYLFEFLKDISSHSDENMMDTHNLSVCFGPTLLRAPETEDLVTSQSRLIEVVDNIIVFGQEVFPATPGRHYRDGGISPATSLDTISESVCDGSEDDSVLPFSILAIARDDYQSQSAEELSFRKGQHMYLSSRIDNTWWRGKIGDQEGLVRGNHVNIPELNSPEPPTGFNRQNLDRLETALSHTLTPPDIVQDLPQQRPKSASSPISSPFHSPHRSAPKVKPKPMRPVPSVRRNAGTPNSKTQTL